MTLVQGLVAGLTVLGLFVWLGHLVSLLRLLRGVPRLAQLRAEPPGKWPKVSVVIPARDEAHTLGAALAAHLSSDYPELEFVLVDDRSRDGTGDLMDRLAETDPRIRAIHIDTLPDGWLGKVHALEVGRREATGDWILFTDADAHVRADTLRRVVPWCESERADLLGAIIHMYAPRLWLDLVAGVVIRNFCFGFQPWRAPDSKARQVFALGAFILVRRTALEQSEGFPGLRLEVLDDMSLALVIKRAGGTLRVVNACDAISVAFFTTHAEMLRTTEKGAYPIFGRYSVPRTILFSALLLTLDLAPLAGFLPVGLPWLPALATAGLLAMTAINVATMRALHRSAWSGILYPLGLLWTTWLSMRSALVGGLAGGIRWRDTFYPRDMMRKGSRFRWP